MDAVQLDYAVTPFRAQKFYELYYPAIKRPLTYGATGYLFYRDEEDADHFVHLIFWEDRAGFYRWWYSQEMQDIRVAIGGPPRAAPAAKWNTVPRAGLDEPDRSTRAPRERGALSLRGSRALAGGRDAGPVGALVAPSRTDDRHRAADRDREGAEAPPQAGHVPADRVVERPLARAVEGEGDGDEAVQQRELEPVVRWPTAPCRGAR